jgi:hypothetical protein
MSGEGNTRQRLADYIAGLKPGTQMAVLRELERAQLRGEPLLPSFNEVAEALRRNIRQCGQRLERIDTPARLFFLPLEPFLIDGSPDRPAPATISRLSLRPIWVWVCRDLLPAQARIYVSVANRALRAEDRASATMAATTFQDQVAPVARTTLSMWRRRVGKRLQGYMAPETALEDVEAMIRILRRRDAMACLSAALPPRIDDPSDPAGARIADLLRPLLQADQHLFVLALALLMPRLRNPWQVVRFAAGDGRAFALAKDFALGRVEATVAALRNDTDRRWQDGEMSEVLRSLRVGLDEIWSELRLAADAAGAVRWRQIAGSLDLLDRLATHHAGRADPARDRLIA